MSGLIGGMNACLWMKALEYLCIVTHITCYIKKLF